MAKTPSDSLSRTQSAPTVLIVIVNWNGKNDLLECLASLEKLNYPQDKYKILVVDNASNDGSQAAIAKVHPGVFLVENHKNVDYVQAVNQGIACGLDTGVDYIWIFNNDVVVEENALMKMVEIGERDKRIGVLGPVIYSYTSPQTIDNVGYKVNYWFGQLKKLRCNRDIFTNPSDQMSEITTILGCSNLIKTSVFRKIGLFRSIYKLYFEETDFNIRAKGKGFRIVVVKGAKVWHKNASTMNRYIFRRAYLLLRNIFLFELFNAELKHLLVFIPYYFLIHIPYFLVFGSAYAVKVKLKERKKKKHEKRNLF